MIDYWMKVYDQVRTSRSIVGIITLLAVGIHKLL